MNVITLLTPKAQVAYLYDDFTIRQGLEKLRIHGYTAIPVLDRIGGGDGFVGGLLYAIARDWEPEKWIRFGWACGAYVTTLLVDYGQPADEEQIWSIYEGNARVKR